MSMQFGIHKHRMEALIDGVFAIAMTILVLEVKVPELENPRDGAALLHALQHHLYIIIAYFISFAMLGLFWVWHHRLASKVKEIDGALMLCSLGFLSLICFFPFAAALFGRYMFYTPAALLVYLPVVGLILLSQALYFFVAIKRKLIHEDVSAEAVRSAHKHNLYACGIFCLTAIPSALIAGISVAAGCAVAASLLIWRAIKA
ncbi:TMEM175 family protein [Undibacterium sp. Ji50W]|uniref:TMEM175 family protein n=1 Tax=Undibacterium sp. Ji50W TaxID=3413041 RepID=UPI003BF4390B